MQFQYTPYGFSLLAAAVLAAILAVVGWRRRPGPGIGAFVALMISLVVWLIINTLEHASPTFDQKLFFSNLTFAGITAVPASWFLFTADYTGRGRWLTRRNIALLTIEPVVVLLAAYTDPLHHLWRTYVGFDTSGAYPVLVTSNGIIFWLHAAYSYVLLVAGVGLLVQALIRSPRIYRGQFVLLLVGALVPWVANAITIFSLSPWPNLDLTPFAFTVTGAAMGLSIVGFRMLDLVPVARDILIENMHDPVVAVDARDRIVDINPAALSLVDLKSRSDALGKPAVEVFAKIISQAGQYIDLIQGSAEVSLDHHGGTRHYELTISPLYGRGELTGRLFVLHDITTARQAARQAEAANVQLISANRAIEAARAQAVEASRLKSEFLATMSHELRTPLNAIMGYADLLRSGVAGEVSADQKGHLDRIVSNSDRLLTLITDVLDFSSIEAGRVEMNNQEFDLAKMLARASNLHQVTADHKDLRFETHLDPALPASLVGDVKYLEQIITNLVSNAIKFTDVGFVRIEFRRRDNARWQIVVTDSGIGISEQAQEYIFDEFRQVDGSSRRKYGGTGLGLAIVRRLVRLMNGDVTVESREGEGSTFRVTLPMIATTTGEEK